MVPFSLHNPIHYDGVRKRLWILGQRCHHGAGGALLAGAAVCGIAAARLSPLGGAMLATTGGLLMAHDWQDRTVWFRPGPQSPGRLLAD